MPQASIRSKQGGFLNLPVPSMGQVDIEDVAHSLGMQCRCNGHTSDFFSVAQHCAEVSVLCSKEAKRFNVDPIRAGMAGLLHDAPEYITGDVISPMKRRLGAAYREYADEVDAVVYAGLGVTDLMAENEEIVKWADLEMLASDMARWNVLGNIVNRDGVQFQVTRRGIVPPPFELRFGSATPMSPIVARNVFIRMYRSLRLSLDEKKVIVPERTLIIP